MSEGEDESQKTEEPTQKRLDDARKKGDVAKSQEIPGWFILMSALLLLAFIFPAVARNMAGSLQVFFGQEHVSSGSFVVPDAPYFIALHLCENDEINKPETGRFYHKGGRFVCVAHPKPGETVTTKFNLKQAFKDYYGFDAPPLYGFIIEYDTKGAPNGGKTSAFVKKIEFPASIYMND